VEFFDAAGSPLSNQPQEISWQPEMAEKENYPHFMLKEIFEQPRAVRDTLRGRLSGDNRVTLEDELGPAPALRAIEAVKIVACGTSLHAGLVGKFMIEELARIPVEVDYASEFRYRKPVIDAKTLVVAISQSGETADTLAAISKARDLSAPILSVCNVVGSMVSRQSDHVLYTRAGPEIGVASTKAFTTQLVALELVALHLAALRGTGTGSDLEGQARRLRQIPELLERVFEADCAIAALAERLCRHSSFLYLGRGTSYPIALEGALKLKEISYIHAEGYPAGEMKHGPIALIDREMPVVVLAPRDEVVRKTLGNIEEIKVRDGIVVAVATEGDNEAAARADHVLYIPPADPLLHPLLSVVPLQLLAYHIAALRGCDIDKPRNLAKSVTVE
jgi:glucosamine--fructose-6-phosphate aminotransferase (isomerizing)